MSLRDKQKEMTRDLIVDALAEIVTEQGPRTFSLEDVAERAGVSLRTLYRYYPGREELLAALTVKLEQTMDLDGEQMRSMQTLEGSLSIVTQRMEFFSEHEKLARAALAIIAGTEGIAENREGEPTLRSLAGRRATRHAHLRKLVNREYDVLPEETRAQIFAVIRTLGSMVGWGQMTGPAGGLDGREAGIAAQWAIKTLHDRVVHLTENGVERLEDDL